MKLRVSGELIYWRGPSPWHFIDLGEDASDQIGEMAPLLTYGWGVIPVTARVRTVSFRTSLFPKEGRYLLPVRAAVRTQLALELGGVVDVEVTLGD